MQSNKNWSYRIPTGGGDNFGKLGQSVSVEAQTTIAKGDRFVGVKNTEDTTKKLVSSPIGFPIGVLSEDLSVGFATQTLGDGEQLPVYFLNEEGNYDTYLLTIPAISEVKSALGYTSNFTSSSIKINEDGTYGFIDFNSVSKKNQQKTLVHYVGLITFNKKEKTADFKIISNPLGDISDLSIKVTDSAGSVLDVIANTSWDKARLHDNILICSMFCFTFNKVNNSELTCTIQAIIELPSFNIRYRGGHNSGLSNISTSVKTENGYYIIASSSYLYKFSDSEYLGSCTGGVTSFSKGGKYGCKYDNSKGSYNLYSIDSVGLGISQVYQKTGISYISYAYPSEDGTMVLTSGGIYNEAGKLYNATTAPSNGMFTPNKWVTGNNMYSISPSTNAEYLISKTESYDIEADKVYGIASEDLLVGIKGTAQKIFGV